MRFIIILAVLLTQSTILLAQNESKIYSVFVLSFIKYVEWPDSKVNENIVIGVLGNTDVEEYLKIASTQKPTGGNQKILIKHCRVLQDVLGCHIVFVANDKSSLMPELINQFSSQAILMVTEKEGYARRAGGISFKLSDGKVKFEINKNAMEKRGLKVASTLTSLGIVVED